MKKKIYTIGYTTFDIENFIKELKEHIPEMLEIRKQRKETKREPLSELQLALLENNELLKESITQAVIKEMGYLFQAQDMQEEERYKKLDCLIRQQQSLRKESSRPAPFRQFRKIFEG